MAMIAALDVDRDIDLGLFSTFLRQQGIAHRVAEEGARQVVWVNSEDHVEYVRDLYARFDRGEFRLEGGNRPPVMFRTGGAPIIAQLRRVPLTALLILVNVLCYPVAFGLDTGEPSAALHALTFVPFEVRGEYVYFGDLGEVFARGEYWRLLTPMFIHFSLLHIAFNLLWTWEIGRRIELSGGVLALVPLVIVSSLGANVAQYLMTGASLFGGMSGVVFGLLGYALVWSRLVPHKDLGLPTGVYIFMLVFLAIGFSGALDFLLPGNLANGAHLGGLVGGLLVGLIAVALEKFRGQFT